MNAMMNGIPWLTIITVLPVVGAAIALLSGKHARGVAQVTGVIAFALVAGDLVALAGRWVDRHWRNCIATGCLRWEFSITWASMGWER